MIVHQFSWYRPHNSALVLPCPSLPDDAAKPKFVHPSKSRFHFLISTLSGLSRRNVSGLTVDGGFPIGGRGASHTELSIHSILDPREEHKLWPRDLDGTEFVKRIQFYRAFITIDHVWIYGV